MHWTLIDCWEKIGGGHITLSFFHERKKVPCVTQRIRVKEKERNECVYLRHKVSFAVIACGQIKMPRMPVGERGREEEKWHSP